MAEILAGDSYGRMHACSISTKAILKTYGPVTANAHINNLSVSEDVFVFGHTSKSICFYNLQQEKESIIEIESESRIVGSDMVSEGAVYGYDDSSIVLIEHQDLYGTIEKENIIYER